MSALFDSASSQRLVNSAPPITNYPITVALWFFVTSVAADVALWALSDAGTATNYFRLGFPVGGAQARMGASTTANGESQASATWSGLSSWHFMVGRFISATNRRMAVLMPNGAVSHGADTASRAPSGLDRMSIGSLEHSAPAQFMDGRIAEVWYTNTDIQADGAQLQDAMLRQLAWGGPFSVPHIACNVAEYRSQRVHPSSDGDQFGEIYHGRFGRQTWGNVGGVTTGPHPPLPYWYRSQPNDRIVPAII